MRMAAVCTFLFASPALACMPGDMLVSQPTKGPSCAVSQTVSDALAVGLDEARDFTAGVVVQRTYETDGCGSEQTLIVYLCGQDQALILGTERYHVMLTPEEQVNQGALDGMEKWVRQATRRKMVLSPEVLVAKARDRGLDVALELPASGAIRMGGKRFPLACACQTYYPGP
jgi:hypothetical protein